MIAADKYNERSNTPPIALPASLQDPSVQIEMDEGDVQPVLRCVRCNKPFDKRECYVQRPLG